jgi:ATP-dependent Clp protease protease subunit
MQHIQNPVVANLIPMVIEATDRGERSFDIFSMLLRQRIIYLNYPVNSQTAGLVIAQLIYLESEDPKADITMYINSPGGEISSGMGIFDTMNYIKPDVSTICVGMAASMGSFLLAGGTKGKRFALPNAEVMIHQPLGGAQGQCSDIQIQARHIQSLKDKLNGYYVDMTGQPLEVIEKDTDRDNWLTAQAAQEYGLIDQVLYKR